MFKKENIENQIPTEKASTELRDSLALPVISLEATALVLMLAIVHCPDYIPFILQAGATATLISLVNTGRHVLKYKRDINSLDNNINIG
jgi:hypothetical protein